MIESDRIIIYGLCDESGSIRYIGKAKDPEYRLTQHLQPSQLNMYRSRKNSWIKGMLSKGFTPGLVLLSSVPSELQNEEECRVIKLFRNSGYDLVNGTNGGDGGAITDPDALARIRAAHLGSKRSDETKRKMSDSAKKRCSAPIERERMKSISNRKPPIRYGIDNNQSKLTEDQVLSIKERHSQGESGVSLAKSFNVTPANISSIVRGKTWSHVVLKEREF